MTAGCRCAGTLTVVTETRRWWLPRRFWPCTVAPCPVCLPPQVWPGYRPQARDRRVPLRAGG